MQCDERVRGEMSRCKHNRTEQAREGNRTKLCKWHLKSNDNTHTRQTDGAPLTMRDEKGNRTKKMQRRSNEERRIRWRITLALRCFAVPCLCVVRPDRNSFELEPLLLHLRWCSSNEIIKLSSSSASFPWQCMSPIAELKLS